MFFYQVQIKEHILTLMVVFEIYVLLMFTFDLL